MMLKKTTGIITLMAWAIIALSACNGSFSDPGVSEILGYDSGSGSMSGASGGSSGSSRSFDGTWELDNLRLIINGSNWDRRNGSTSAYKGTFTYNATTLTIYVEQIYITSGNHSYWGTYTDVQSYDRRYTLSADGKTLTISGSGGTNALPNGTWTKR